jgi:hypothetical protein
MRHGVWVLGHTPHHNSIRNAAEKRYCKPYAYVADLSKHAEKPVALFSPPHTFPSQIESLAHNNCVGTFRKWLTLVPPGERVTR